MSLIELVWFLYCCDWFKHCDEQLCSVVSAQVGCRVWPITVGTLDSVQTKSRTKSEPELFDMQLQDLGHESAAFALVLGHCCQPELHQVHLG